jgi:homoserine O-acetyltransferase/O-succinyltransferase
MPILKSALAVLLAFSAHSVALAQQSKLDLPIQQGDYIAHNFKFGSGETLPDLRLHYRTLGEPKRDANGHVSNAVLILHGTGGTGAQFLGPQFAGVLFEPGQLLDAAKYYIILPDGIGHGGSSKPSDGMHAHFPSYDYDDMVAAQHLLLTEGLHVDHLRLIMGTSMGCMHSWVWGETYPGFSDALMPLACLPVQIAGRNRMMRKMAMDAIRDDPAWNNGEYTAQPPGLKTSLDMLLIMGSSPLQMQKNYPTRDQADTYLENFVRTRFAHTDANDFLYQFNSSRNYDPLAKLATVTVPVMAINSADDFINPPELNIMPEAIKKVPRGKFVLLPITDQTRGHGTHTLPAIWQGYLAELLKESEPATR